VISAIEATYELRPGERDGMPCWEVCYPPVPAKMDKGQPHPSLRE
jgi:hypothetical protein